MATTTATARQKEKGKENKSGNQWKEQTKDKERTKKPTTQEKERTQWQYATDVANQVAWPKTAKQQPATCQTQHMSNNTTTGHNGLGQQYQQPQQTPQLALTAPQHTAAQEPQTPAIHLVAALDNKMSTTPTASTLQSVLKSTSGSTVAQQHMSAHHGLRPTHPCTQCNMGRGPIDNSNRWNYPSVWIQMGLDEQHQQATTGYSLLCVRSDTTHHVSNKTGRTRVQHTAKWDTNSHTHKHKGIQFSTCLTWWTLLYFMTMEFVNIPVDMQLEVHQTTQGTTAIITPVTLIPAGMEVLRNRNDLWTFKQSRIPGESAEITTQSTLHARPTVSSSNRKVGEL